MSRTLNFVDHLLLMGRNLQRLGQNQAAARLFLRLSTFPHLSMGLAEEAQFRLAELHLNLGQYKKARRHLAAALAYQPDNPHYHHLMATILEDDDEGNQDLALEHYRLAVKFDPHHTDYLCDHGLCALGQDRAAEGLKALRRAAELAPDDPEVLRRVVQGLGEEGELGEAQSLLRAALFRHPRDERFKDLWSRHQFQVLSAEQDSPSPARLKKPARPMLLPFVRPAPDNHPKPVGRKLVRRDLPSPTPPPHQPAPRRLANKKKAR